MNNLMDEKTAMNVEFLRARLLSERIVSKTARQRAEMLSQRVIELEEQLRIVNFQRKKAEKAAEEVLSILETQGITCISGLTDSSTDQENNHLTDQDGNQRMISEDVKEDSLLTSSRKDRSEIDDGLSCSDIDGSHSDYNCLSWKSHDSSLDSQDKLKAKQNRHGQRSSFITTMKSSQRRPGKSCRKIKKPDVGSASDNESQKPTLLDAHGNGVVAHPDDFDEKHEYPLQAFESKMDKFSVDSSLPFRSDGRNRESKDGGGKDDMERALEQQAQLIIQFQAMENAQKEWEEKFNETKMSMLDNLEPRNQVNIDENSNLSADKSKLVDWIPQHEEEDKISVKDISLTEAKSSGRCRNCEMADKKLSSDEFSPGILSTSLSIPSRNGSNGGTNGSLNPMCESTAINVIETVSKAFTFPLQYGSDLARKPRLGPNLEKFNTASDSNLKLHSHDQAVLLQFSAKEHPKHPSHADGLMVQQYDTMAEANHATQVLTIPSQESPVLVASRKDLRGSIYEKPNAVFHRNSKMNFQEKLTPIIDEKISDKELPEVKEPLRQISRTTGGRSLGSVLQSLQRARISVRQELVKMPNSAQTTMTMASPASSPIKPNVAIDSSVLFRLPSDSFPPALSRPNIYGSGLRLTATRPDLGFTNTNTTVLPSEEYLHQSPSASYVQPGSKVSFSKDSGDHQYSFGPCMDGVSSTQVRNVYANRYPARFVESESRLSTVKEYFDRHTNSSISASSVSGYPLYYPDLSSKRLSFHNDFQILPQI